MVMVIIAGHIDLSVGSRRRVHRRDGRRDDHPSGTCRGRSPSCSAWSSAPLVGAWQGFWIAYFGIPAFIVTLAGHAGVPRRRRRSRSDNQQISLVPDRVPGDRHRLPARRSAAPGYEPLTLHPRRCSRSLAIVGPAARGSAWCAASTTSRTSRSGWFVVKLVVHRGRSMLIVTLLLASYNGTPIVLIILAVLVVVYTAVMNRTRLRPPHLRDRRQPRRGRSCPA